MIAELILTILSVSIPITYIIDFAGIAEKFKKWKYYRRYSKDSPYVPYDLKPFDCSGCLSVWTYWFLYGVLPWSMGIATIGLPFIIVGGFATGLTTLALRKYILY